MLSTTERTPPPDTVEFDLDAVLLEERQQYRVVDRWQRRREIRVDAGVVAGPGDAEGLLGGLVAGAGGGYCTAVRNGPLTTSSMNVT